MEPEVMTLHDELEGVRRHRAELRESVIALEHSLAAPIPGRPTAWTERVRAALMELLADFREHVDITEGQHGLYTRVLRTAPRLASAVRRLTQEHADLLGHISELLERVESDPDVDAIRELGTRLLGTLVRHRQRGSDLVYEAYEVDIGGEE